MLRKVLFWRILLVIYLAAVSYICFASQGGLPTIENWPFKIPADKCVHFVMFLPWPVLACLSVLPIGAGRTRKAVITLLIITLLGCALAGATEWIQGLLPYRSRDVVDFIADCLGLLTGALLFAAFYPFLQRSKTR
ncbi:MAG: VanZ family protein [Bacteroidales bacterium]|nr:VanZ family protein [Bacteroidales bacterium]